jgi:hypothetical protein
VAIERQREMGDRSSMKMLPVLLLLGACQGSVVGAGPHPGELVAAIRSAPAVAGPAGSYTSEVRSLGCRAFDEEPTEFLCRFQSKDSTGAWRARSAIVAADGDGWVLLSFE